MSMKKILMAAAAVTALTAGVANAATLDLTNSTIGSTNLAQAGGTSSTTVSEPYTIASELNAPGSIPSVLQFVPTGSIAAGTYLVTWTISGGTFDTTSVVYSGVQTVLATVTAQTTSPSTGSATSLTGIFSSTNTPTSFKVAVPIITGTGKSPVVITGSITTQQGVAVDGGAIAAQTVIDYRAGLKLQSTNRTATLALSTFKQFYGWDASATPAANTSSKISNAVIATAVGYAANDNPTAASDGRTSDFVWAAPGTAGAVGTKVSGNVGTLVSSSSITISGSFSAFQPVLASASPTGGVTTDYAFTNTQSPTTLGTGSMTLTGTQSSAFNAGTAVIGLLPLDSTALVAGSESTYSITATPSAQTGYTAQTYAAKSLGSVVFEGTTINAPWVGDGTNGINTTIRLNNQSATAAIPYVQVKLISPFTTGTSGSVASTATCSVGAVPAGGELLITSEKLQACFGNFKRADVTVTLGAGVATGVTAKMRTTAVNGTVSEVTLGKGSGTALAF